MAGSLQLETTFTITGRGLVLAGQIVDGTVKIGGRVVLPEGPGGTRNERVTGIEFIDGHNDDGTAKSAIGLLLDELPVQDIAALRSQLTPGLVLRVEDPEPGYQPPPVPSKPSWARRPWWQFWSKGGDT